MLGSSFVRRASVGANLLEFSQLNGGAGPAGSLLPWASKRLMFRVRGLGAGVSGRSRSWRISEGRLGAITGTSRGPSGATWEALRAARSSDTVGESSLPSSIVSHGYLKKKCNWTGKGYGELRHLRPGAEAVADADEKEWCAVLGGLVYKVECRFLGIKKILTLSVKSAVGRNSCGHNHR